LQTSQLKGILQFLKDAEKLKTVTRSAFTSAGQPEDVAAHTWRLCLMALLLACEYPDLDMARLLKICLVHDLGEALGGDIPAVCQDADKRKATAERKDLLKLIEPLPRHLRKEITGLWDEYENAATSEARLAKALDKLETILQHNQGRNPPDFDYAFNLDYGAAYTRPDPLIMQLRNMLDEETRVKVAAQTGGEKSRH
jgi:putative hydrolase of HD superfamily